MPSGSPQAVAVGVDRLQPGDHAFPGCCDDDGTLHVTPTAGGIRLTGESDLCTRAEFDAALRALAGRPQAALVLDIADLSFLDARSAGAVLRLAAELIPPRRLEVRCRNHHRRMLRLLGGRSIRQLSIVTERL